MSGAAGIPSVNGGEDVKSSAERPRQTPLRAVHERLGATMTSFAGRQMPLRYASETAEHLAVRRAAGLFDLSHMGEIAVAGPQAAAALDYALVGNLSALQLGRARYTMICAEDGGVLDDLVVYGLGDDEFLIIANASNTAVVFGAVRERAAGHDARVTDATDDYALVAIQGPAAAGILTRWPAIWTSARSSITRGRSARWPGAGPGWRAPGTPARTASRCSAARRTRSRSGRRWLRAVLGPAWSRRAWPPAIRSGLRPACRCTATSSART